MGSKDLDNDVIDLGAYAKTIQERGPKGKNLVWHLTDHWPDLKHAVGKFSELYEEGNKLIGITDIPNTSWGNDVMEFYKTGTINQHSIGFRIIKHEPQNAGTPNEYRLIKEILLYEGSAVLWGANPNTPTLSVGKTASPVDIATRYQQLTKAFKEGNYTDETFAILDAQIKQIEQDMAAKYLQSIEQETTEPVITTQPDEQKGIAEGIYLLTLKHF
jgi:HK97 family phage prohead protease